MFTILKENFSFRKQILSLAKADIIKTYKGAALGWMWALIKPAMTIFVYWFAFSIGLRSGGLVDGHEFFVWLIAGIVPWFYMSEMITSGTESIRRYRYLVTKMKFPVSTVATFVSMSKMIIHLGLLLITFIILFFKGYKPDIYLLQFFYYIPAMFLFFTFWSLFSGPLASISRDYANLVRSTIVFIFWFSGILYDPTKIQIPWVRKLLMLNPVSYFAQGYRETLLFKKWFWESPKQLMAFVIVFLVMMILGIWSYTRLRKEIPDVL